MMICLENINTFNDLVQEWLNQVQDFFSTYKNWKKEAGATKVLGFKNANWSWEEYQHCFELMKNMIIYLNQNF